ncbi:MAG: hypothetical protein HUJ68_01425, partial [Clostridia bacterium]|nr:hypothetical protein [Clostridia bacterium]
MATNYKRARRKTALITTTLAIVTILAIAVTGTVVFLKDRGTTEAAELQENEQQVSNQTSTGNETNVTNENIEPEVAGAQNGAEVITDTETGTTGTQTGTQTGAQTGTTTGAQTGVQTGTQTGAQAGTTTDTIQEATIIRTETVEIPEKQISEGHYVGWTPIDVEAELASAKINTQIPNLKVEKTAYTKSGKNLAKQGEEIVYVIKITSDKELKAIEVKDLIPVGTKYVSASDNGREVSENGIVKGIIWSVDLTEKNNDGLYEANVKLTVKVNDDQTGIIENIAIANGESSEDEDGNGTRTAVIETSKTSTINRNNQIVKEPAKVGDEITYTISVVNTGEIAGTTKIKDVDLEKLLGDGKAELVGNIKLYEGNDIKNNNIDKVQLINGINDVDVPAGKEVKVVFTIKLNKVLGKIINTATIGEDGTETDEIDTLNVDVQKEVKEIKRNGVVVNEPVKVGDVIYYNITIENTGSIDQNVEVKDVLANNQRELELYNEETIVKEVTVNAGDKIVLTANYIVEQDDIDAQKVLTNVATIKYDNEEKTSDVTTEVEKQNQSYIATKTADKEKVSKAGEEITY